MTTEHLLVIAIDAVVDLWLGARAGDGHNSAAPAPHRHCSGCAIAALLAAAAPVLAAEPCLAGGECAPGASGECVTCSGRRAVSAIEELRAVPGPRPRCANYSPPWYTGRWRDWHRGHGCDKDDGDPRSAEGAAEIERGGAA